MRVALCCPGPSLKTGDIDVTGYDLVIGVNEAVEYVAAHWWFFAERDVPERFTPLRTPDKLVAFIHSEYKDVPLTMWHEYGVGGNWSATAAIKLVGKLEPDVLHVYGIDLEVDEGIHRSSKRWALERVQTKLYLEELVKAGIEVKTYGAYDPFRSDDCCVSMVEGQV